MYTTYFLNNDIYLYSGKNKKIIKISKRCSEILSDIQKKIYCSDTTKNEEVEYLIANGFIGEYNPVFSNNAKPFIKEHINNRRKYLVLQVTQKCNLICSYCPYACTDNDSRNHKNIDMPMQVAIRAVDDYVEHARDINILNFGFYGGEPLLNFRLIRNIVEYIETHVSNKMVVFSMTTNGTLLTKDVIEYLVKKGFMLTISLDGDRVLHDKHRKFPTREGSFGLVYSNMKYIYENFREFWKNNVSFNAVVNSYLDFNRSLLFFSNDSMFEDEQDIRINFSENVKTLHLSQDEKYANKISSINQLNNKKYYLELMLFYYMKRKKTPNYILDDIEKLKQIEQNQNNICSSFEDIIHPQGQCISGATKLMVDVYGNYWPCEKVNENCDFCKIGDIYSGINEDQVARQIEISELTKDECLQCWAIHHCSFCLAKFNEHSCITKKLKLQICKKEKNRLKGLLKIYSILQYVYSKYGYNEGIEI